MSWTSGYGLAPGSKTPWGNGDGRFIYPPVEAADAKTDGPLVAGPVDSIRWEMLRDGIEDYEYLAILRRLLESEKATDAQRERYCSLLDVPADISASVTEFTGDPAPIQERRASIARAIERLQSAQNK